MENAAALSVRFAPSGPQLLGASRLKTSKSAARWCGSLQRGAHDGKVCRQPRCLQIERSLFGSSSVWGCHFFSSKKGAHVSKGAAARNLVVVQAILGEVDQVKTPQIDQIKHQTPTEESDTSDEHPGAAVLNHNLVDTEENVGTQSVGTNPSLPAGIPPPSTTATSSQRLDAHPLESEAPVNVLPASSAVDSGRESTSESLATPESLLSGQEETHAGYLEVNTNSPTSVYGSNLDGMGRTSGVAHTEIRLEGGGLKTQLGQSVSDPESASSAEIASPLEQQSPQSGGGKRRKKPPPTKYVWPELRNPETKESDFEYLTVDPSGIPERRKSSLNTSSSGRAMRYMAPGPRDKGPEKAPSVKREPSAAAQKCLTLLSEYKDPVNLPYEEFRETLNAWAVENEPRRSDGMDVLRTLLDCEETRVFIRVSLGKA